MEILVATKNKGKIKELKNLLAELPVNLRSLDEFPDITEPEETGATFAENAILKAKYYALETGLLALADDSGLEVEALGGEPGVFSARYAGQGTNTNDRKNTAKLLQELDKAQNKNRAARFFCAMVLADKKGNIKYLAEGICEGEIALEPFGINGFGYDPVFIPRGFERTFGELDREIKRKISHRARATAKIIEFLNEFFASELDQTSFRL